MIKKVFYVIGVFAFLNVTSAYAACPVSSNDGIAAKIASGHAWRNHKSEFVSGKVIAGLAMPSSPKITSSSSFRAHIFSVISSGKKKSLKSGRRAYWWASTGTIVIYDPRSNDCGTAFRPSKGKNYFNGQR